MKLTIKKAHIAEIILGIIFVCLGIFHTNIWFDESYSVAIANKGFGQIWQITGNDVHPALYYWLLHIVNMIFGANIIAYRLLSALAIMFLSNSSLDIFPLFNSIKSCLISSNCLSFNPFK